MEVFPTLVCRYAGSKHPPAAAAIFCNLLRIHATEVGNSDGVLVGQISSRISSA